MLTTQPDLPPFVLPLKGTQQLELSIGDQEINRDLKSKSLLRLPFAYNLVDSKGDLLFPETDFNFLHLPGLDAEAVEKLSALMPRMVHLEVAIANVNIAVFPHFIALLTKWASTLKTLQLVTGHFHSTDGPSVKWAPFSTVARNQRLLLEAINKNLLFLEQLTLDIKGSFSFSPEEGVAEPLAQAIADADESLKLDPEAEIILLPTEDVEGQLHRAMANVEEVLGREAVAEIEAKVDDKVARAGQLLGDLVSGDHSAQLVNGTAADGDPPLSLSFVSRLKVFKIAIDKERLLHDFLHSTFEKSATQKQIHIAIGEDGTPWNVITFQQ